MLRLSRYLATICVVIIVIFFSGCYYQIGITQGEKSIDTNGNKYVTTSGTTVYYTDNISSGEISALLKILGGSQIIKLDKINETYYVYFIVADKQLKKVEAGNEDVEFDQAFKDEAWSISDLAFDNSPVVVNVCDDSFKIYKSYKYHPNNE